MRHTYVSHTASIANL